MMEVRVDFNAEYALFDLRGIGCFEMRNLLGFTCFSIVVVNLAA